MASLDEELLQDAEDDAAAVAFIAERLTAEERTRFNDETLYYFLDVLCEYYAEGGVLDAEPNAEGFVEVDEEAVAKHLAAQARKEKIGNYSVDELLPIVQHHLEYEETQLGE